jgi:hypothetical protein
MLEMIVFEVFRTTGKDMQYFGHMQDEKVHIHHHIHCFHKMNFANSGYYPIYI